MKAERGRDRDRKLPANQLERGQLSSVSSHDQNQPRRYTTKPRLQEDSPKKTVGVPFDGSFQAPMYREIRARGGSVLEILVIPLLYLSEFFMIYLELPP